jgi:type II secretory pathway pseudopilin PulG
MRQENSNPASGCGCLVLLMCIGVLTAIALPSYMSSVNKAKQSEAKQYVSLLNKGQKTYYVKNTGFSNSIDALRLGIKAETTNYKYSTRVTEQAAFNYGVSKQEELKSYVGAVFVFPAKEVDPNAAKDEMTTTYILCEANNPGTIEPAKPIYQNGKVICGKDTTEMSRYQESEVKHDISLMNKGQQDYYAEKSAFNNSIYVLRQSIETDDYKYSTRATKQAAFNYGIAKQETKRSYVGGVFLVPAKKVDANADQNEMITLSILCKANNRGIIKPAEPTYQNGKLICGKGTTKLTK